MKKTLLITDNYFCKGAGTSYTTGETRNSKEANN